MNSKGNTFKLFEIKKPSCDGFFIVSDGGGVGGH